jgi:hypothetical protein
MILLVELLLRYQQKIEMIISDPFIWGSFPGLLFRMNNREMFFKQEYDLLLQQQ